MRGDVIEADPVPPPLNTPLAATDSLASQQFVLAVIVLGIVAGTVAAVFWRGSTEVQSMVAGTVIGTGLGSVAGFFFGSSKGSQKKDEILAAQTTPPPPGGTTTTTTTASSVLTPPSPATPSVRQEQP